jgi:hypothetical protein
MDRAELKQLFEEALTSSTSSGKFEYDDLIPNKVYHAYDVRIIDTKFGKKVVSNLEGESGIFFFPNKIQQAMIGKSIGENVKIKFRFLEFEKVGKFKTCKIEIV